MKEKNFVPLANTVQLVIDRRGVTPFKLGSEWKESGYRVLSARNIHTGEIVSEDTIRFIDKETYKKWMKEEIQINDIIITSEAPFGNVYHWKTDEKIVLGQRLFAIRINKNYDSSFVYYALTSESFQYELRKRCSGSTVTGLRQPELLKCKIINLEIPEQKHIAKILADIDSKISINKKIIKELEMLAKELYDYWFVQFDFPNINGKPYKSSGGKMLFNTILKREIPEGWKVESINNFCKSYRGVSYDKSDLLNGLEDGVLVLRGNNIDGNTLVYDENVAYVPHSFVEPEQKIKKHDIIMTMSSGSKEHVGKCTMFQSDSEHTYGAFMTKFTPNSNCPFFAYRSMLSDFFKAKIKYICGGTGINNLTNQTFDEILFPFPPNDVLKSFESLLTPIYEKVGKNNDEILKLTALRDELLPILMNGQVIVKE